MRAALEEKRQRIVAVAMRHFAERGYAAARVADMARELRIAKGSIFQHFGSKERLFLEAYRLAVTRLPAWDDAPDEVRERGVFATVEYWLERAEHLVREDWIPYRMTLLGNYGADLSLRREINRHLVEQDPYGTARLVRRGVESGELRQDVDPELLVSVLDWTMDRFQDALLTEELDSGLFHRPGGGLRRQERIRQFLEVLRSALGAPASARRGGGKPRRPPRPKNAFGRRARPGE